MAEIDVGGNGSVEWTIRAGNRPNAQSLREMVAARGAEAAAAAIPADTLSGVDVTAPGQWFNVQIEIPATPNAKLALAHALQAAAATAFMVPAGSGAKLSFAIPIENRNPDQIRITWNS
jgi:hypothetical protein